jgi:hypothetical protein
LPRYAFECGRLDDIGHDVVVGQFDGFLGGVSNFRPRSSRACLTGVPEVPLEKER